MLPRLFVLALLALAATSAASCSSGAARCEGAIALPAPKAGACGLGEFLYEDRSCSAPGGSGSDSGAKVACFEEGDELCHRRCASDADCGDPCRPFCRVLGLWDGYDSSCNAGVRICRERDVDDCKPPTLK